MIKSLHLEEPSGIVDALGEMGDERAFEPLLNLYKDSEWHVKPTIILAMAKLKAPQGYLFLVDKLRFGKGWQVKEEAAKALGDFGNPRAVDYLVESLSNGSDWLRRIAIKAIYKLGGFEAIKTAAEDSIDMVHIQKDIRDFLRFKYFTRLREGENTSEIFDDEIAFIREELNDPVRRNDFVCKLKNIKDKRVVKLSCEFFCDYSLTENDGEPLQEFNRWLSRILGEMGDIQVVPHLIRGLNDEHWGVRRGTLESLEKLAT